MSVSTERNTINRWENISSQSGELTIPNKKNSRRQSSSPNIIRTHNRFHETLDNFSEEQNGLLIKEIHAFEKLIREKKSKVEKEKDETIVIASTLAEDSRERIKKIRVVLNLFSSPLLKLKPNANGSPMSPLYKQDIAEYYKELIDLQERNSRKILYAYWSKNNKYLVDRVFEILSFKGQLLTDAIVAISSKSAHHTHASSLEKTIVGNELCDLPTKKSVKRLFAFHIDFTVCQLAKALYGKEINLIPKLKTHLTDAITSELMKDPYTIGCGHTFSVQSIESIIKEDKSICKICKRAVNMKVFYPNLIVKKMLSLYEQISNLVINPTKKEKQKIIKLKQERKRLRSIQRDLTRKMPRVCSVLNIPELPIGSLCQCIPILYRKENELNSKAVKQLKQQRELLEIHTRVCTQLEQELDKLVELEVQMSNLSK